MLSLAACNTSDRYDMGTYYNAHEKDALLASIISYIYTAPDYTEMKDRFKPEHRNFYGELTSKFVIKKFYVANDGTHYFFLLRPAPRADENRGVGGYFKRGKNFELTGFREVFVTPLLPTAEAEKRGSFLFEKMVEGKVAEYLKMKSYVQWPNELSKYDTTTYEWKLREDVGH